MFSLRVRFPVSGLPYSKSSLTSRVSQVSQSKEEQWLSKQCHAFAGTVPSLCHTVSTAKGRFALVCRLEALKSPQKASLLSGIVEEK